VIGHSSIVIADMEPYPTGLKLTDDRHLLIEWSDGGQRRYGFKALRDACPCATCREKRSAPQDPLALPTLKVGQLAPLTLTGMKPVGNYAYTIAFSDGHDTGIYSFELLRELGEPA
jgi:DUF971 family protein